MLELNNLNDVEFLKIIDLCTQIKYTIHESVSYLTSDDVSEFVLDFDGDRFKNTGYFKLKLILDKKHKNAIKNTFKVNVPENLSPWISKIVMETTVMEEEELNEYVLLELENSHQITLRVHPVVNTRVSRYVANKLNGLLELEKRAKEESFSESDFRDIFNKRYKQHGFNRGSHTRRSF